MTIPDDYTESVWEKIEHAAPAYLIGALVFFLLVVFPLAFAMYG